MIIENKHFHLVKFFILVILLNAHALSLNAENKETFSDSKSSINESLLDLKNKLELAIITAPSEKDWEELNNNINTIFNTHKKEILENQHQRQLFQKYQNIAAIQQTFQKCLHTFGQKDSLGQNIFDSLFQIDPDKLKCQGLYLTMNKLLIAMKHPISVVKKREILKNMASHARVNVAVNHFDMSFRFNPDKTKVDQLKEKAFLDSCLIACSESDIKRVKEAIERQHQKLKSEEVIPQDTQGVKNILKAQLRNLNKLIKSPILEIESQSEEEAKKEKYQAYLKKFIQYSSQGIGLLHHTESFSNKYEAYQEDNGTEYISFSATKKLDLKTISSDITKDDIELARKEYYKSLGLRIGKINTDLKNSEDGTIQSLNKSFKNMILHNPLAAAQALLENPTSAALFCSAINDIEKEYLDKEGLSKKRKTTLIVSGGALTIAGILSIYRSPVQSPGLVSSGLDLIALGTTLSLTEAGFSTYDYIEAQSEVNELTESLLTGNKNSKDQILKISKQREKVKSELWNISTSLGLSVIGLKGFASGLKYIYNELKLTPSLKHIKDFIKSWRHLKGLENAKKNMNEDDYANMIGVLSGLPKDMQKKALKILSEIKESTQYISFINNLKAAAKAFCKK